MLNKQYGDLMPNHTFSLSEDHEKKLKELCEKEIRKPSAMIQSLIIRRHREVCKNENS